VAIIPFLGDPFALLAVIRQPEEVLYPEVA